MIPTPNDPKIVKIGRWFDEVANADMAGGSPCQAVQTSLPGRTQIAPHTPVARIPYTQFAPCKPSAHVTRMRLVPATLACSRPVMQFALYSRCPARGLSLERHLPASLTHSSLHVHAAFCATCSRPSANVSHHKPRGSCPGAPASMQFAPYMWPPHVPRRKFAIRYQHPESRATLFAPRMCPQPHSLRLA